MKLEMLKHFCLAAAMKNALLVLVLFISLPALADLSATYTDPSQAKQLIQRAIQLPQSQNDTKIFYSDGIAHFDGLIPVSPSMKETREPNKYCNKYTYHDGRISSVEGIDETGATTGVYVVWNDGKGAPVLSVYRNKAGSYDWYMYAEYDLSGKIQKLYSYNDSFELQCYDVFSYQDNVTSIQKYTRDSRPTMETIWDSGNLYLVQNGKKQLTNHADRKQEICELERFGLKPLYPNY